MAANAAALPAEAMNAVTGDGAPWYTSGVHDVERHGGDLEAEPDEQQGDAGEHQRRWARRRRPWSAIDSDRSRTMFVEPVPP